MPATGLLQEPERAVGEGKPTVVRSSASSACVRTGGVGRRLLFPGQSRALASTAAKMTKHRVCQVATGSFSGRDAQGGT